MPAHCGIRWLTPLLALALPNAAIAQSGGYLCPNEPLTDAQLGPDGPMRFSVRQAGKLKVLIAEGGIDAGTPKALEAALKTKVPLAEIWLRSGGGDAAAGNRAAEIIRRSGIPVRIPADWWCISACNFLFFGGTIRMIDDGGQFGVHMATAVNSKRFQDQVTDLTNKRATGDLLAKFAAREQSMAQLTADDIDVILRMGISRKLLSEVMYAQRADQFRDSDGDGKLDLDHGYTFRCLTREQMTRYNVVNVD